jgi:transposase
MKERNSSMTSLEPGANVGITGISASSNRKLVMEYRGRGQLELEANAGRQQAEKIQSTQLQKILVSKV